MLRKFWVNSTYYMTEVQSRSKEDSYHRLAGQSKTKNYTAVLIQRICPADILSANTYFPNNRGVSPCGQGSVVQVPLGGVWCPGPCHQWISWMAHNQPWARAERNWHSEWSFMRFAGKTFSEGGPLQSSAWLQSTVPWGIPVLMWILWGRQGRH